MKPIRWSVALAGLAILLASVSTACSRHYVVVTPPEDGYSQRDTLYGRLIDEGREVRVTFYFDTIFRTDTVVRLDTVWREGTRVDTVPRLRVDTVKILVTDTIVRADTVQVPNDALQRPTVIQRVDTVAVVDTLTRVDTVQVRVSSPMSGTDTVFRTDTLKVTVTDTIRVSTTETVVDTVTRVDTIRVSTTETVTDTVLRVDTLRTAVTDTLVRVDTITVTTTDTVTVSTNGPRHLFIPPGHYPPEGQCRVWVPGDPPGRQPRATACGQLGQIPGGAFILFGGRAWDADWDWVQQARESGAGAIPPEIVALSRKRG